ncbi:MAG: tyrosine--tRNA ligase [Deltaproteobacteria bacterium]|nr:tyrosine--tRNA ligase [Deltaproteobacteria bacterium]
MSIWSIYKERGFFQQATEEDALVAKSQHGPLTGYIGFDPTADSLHVGHLIPLMSLTHFQRAGHRPIALVGGGTAMIGDPSGKNEMRKMLDEATLHTNIAGIKRQMGSLLDFSGGKAILANNLDWLRGLGYIDFLREIGPHFSVNRMLTFETFRVRLAQEGAGLSFLEFNYPLLQSYDFLELHKRYGCSLQMGGDDQWTNIISGVDLVRRIARAQVFGWTFPLLTTASGTKMGKTEKGAVWLDPNKTSPYEYYQYWVNLDDADVAKCLRLFTLLPLEEVKELEALRGADIRQAKQRLAQEATALIHGEEEAARAAQGARAVFGGAGGGAGDLAEVPTSALAKARLADRPLLVDLLAEFGLVKSKGEARRLIQQGGVTVNEAKVDGIEFVLEPALAPEGAILLRLGKKRFHRLVVQATPGA